MVFLVGLLNWQDAQRCSPTEHNLGTAGLFGGDKLELLNLQPLLIPLEPGKQEGRAPSPLFKVRDFRSTL